MKQTGFTKRLCAALAIALFTGTAAADTVASGKIKSINADKRMFVLTNSANKDFVFKIGDKLVVNRGGKEINSDLKEGDAINVCYDKGFLKSTAYYILVQEGSSKSELIRGRVVGYDANKRVLMFTDELKKDSTYSLGQATVRRNMEDAKIESVKIGDHALLIVDMIDGVPTLRSVMIDGAK